MTERRRLWVGITIGVVVGAALAGAALIAAPYVLPWRVEIARTGPSEPAGRPARDGEVHPQTAAPQPEHTEHAAAAPLAAQEGVPQSAEALGSLALPIERLQSIGVRFEVVRPQQVERTVKTVGRVEVDERRLARVNVKLEGWIDRLLVNYTGERVEKGQILFMLYSPELIATQNEYLLALQGRSRLGTSEFPEVADAARALLQVTRQRLRLWDIEESHIRDLERTGVILRTLPIHSPVGGTVISKTAVAGMRVGPGDELYTIADLSRVWVQAEIFEYELPLVTVGQNATVTLSHAPQLSLQAVARFISPTVDPDTRTAKARFEVDNTGDLIKPGMFTNVELKVPLGVRLVIPKDALLETGQRQIVFIHLGGGRLEWRAVKAGLRGDDWIEIVAGVREGDHIITSANFLIDSESQLRAAMGGMKH